MLHRMKYIIAICAILSSALIVIFSELDYFYLFSTDPLNDISISTKKLIEDINNFSQNFKERFRKLKRFISENRNKVDNLDVSYYLFTYMNPKEPYHLKTTQDSWIQSNLDPKHPTIFLIHGFETEINIQNGTYTKMKDNILNRSVYRNVFLMDYSKYSSGLFSETAKMSFLVSQNLANFIHFLMKNASMAADQFHLVGASLGGEVAANAASLVPGLGRLTGLDPAGPIFELLPSNYRISSDDAQFVDIIHTSSIAPFPKGIGISYPAGDMDFYPNGGQYQPGCGDSNKISGTKNKNDVLRIARCNQDRAISLFIESICSMKCQFIGVKCKSYDEFEKGHCTPENSDTAKMG
ncbi:lipoprotein lipase, partial [Parasteatoda tepidariorum]|uniref:lipoprotein lipase n=1 Tax=Parasteatoda tepidariorum TaxID=114398 RepID=UPI0039BCC9D2